MNTTHPVRVSVHGGHSGEFCHHATDSLADVVGAYVEQGYGWVGITEHMPPIRDDQRYPDEVAAGDSAGQLQARFDRYVGECRRLRDEYRDRIEILIAFEIETYPGSEPFIRELQKRHEFDYFVGSLHHVDDVGIDVTPEDYSRAVKAQGGVQNLYIRYFDLQYDMIESLCPAVVGHFDLIRIFDPDYRASLALPAVRERAFRNLKLVRELDLILDVNLRGFDRAASEQYPTRDLLGEAIRLGVRVVPGDDSHGVSSVGRNWDEGVRLLRELGADCRWTKPVQR